MSERDEPEALVPPHLEAGVFANDVAVFDDGDYVSIVRLQERLGGAL